MKVFISWSGHKSEIVAHALRRQIPVVLDGVEPWMSQRDLESGGRWNLKLAEELANTDVGIICLTAENIASPWINFEAGCLAKQLENSKIVPYLIDLDKKAVIGPLSQFQSEYSDQAGTRRLFESLRRTCGRPSDEVFGERFGPAWHQLEQHLAKVTSGSRNDPASDVAISLCYLLLEKGCIREVCERLSASRASRALPPEWLVLAAVAARLTGNRNTERLHRELTALEGQYRHIAAFEQATLAYARGASEAEIESAAYEGQHGLANPDVTPLRLLCRLEEGTDIGLIDFPEVDPTAKTITSNVALNSVPFAILAAAQGNAEVAEIYFDISRKTHDYFGAQITGYPFVQLLAPADRLFVDAIAGVVPSDADKSFDAILAKSLGESRFKDIRGHLHVVARRAKVLASSEHALATIAKVSTRWARPLVPHEMKTRLGQLRKAILQVAGSP